MKTYIHNSVKWEDGKLIQTMFVLCRTHVTALKEAGVISKKNRAWSGMSEITAKERLGEECQECKRNAGG